jgi:hypothetical protein
MLKHRGITEMSELTQLEKRINDEAKKEFDRQVTSFFEGFWRAFPQGAGTKIKLADLTLCQQRAEGEEYYKLGDLVKEIPRAYWREKGKTIESRAATTVMTQFRQLLTLGRDRGMFEE